MEVGGVEKLAHPVVEVADPELPPGIGDGRKGGQLSLCLHHPGTFEKTEIQWSTVSSPQPSVNRQPSHGPR